MIVGGDRVVKRPFLDRFEPELQAGPLNRLPDTTLQTGGSPGKAYGPDVSVIMVSIFSIGTAERTALRTWSQVTTPGIKFKLTTSALRPFFDEAG